MQAVQSLALVLCLEEDRQGSAFGDMEEKATKQAPGFVDPANPGVSDVRFSQELC